MRGVNTFALSHHLKLTFAELLQVQTRDHNTPAVSKLDNTGKMYFGDYFYHVLRITCMETLLKDPPMTPAIASGLSSCRAYEPSGQINSVSSTLVREALTNSRA